MAILLSANNLGHAFGPTRLFQDVSFTLGEGDRVGLIGPNGAGKSSLMQMLGGVLVPDEGEVSLRAGLRVGYLAQTPELPLDQSARVALESSMDAGDPSDGDARWRAQSRLEEVLSKLDLSSSVIQNTRLAELSGGWQKRVALARELVNDPDLLLLDEPTNHLDIDSILWLERFLAQQRFAAVTVTHDRAFLQQVSNRIIELDRRHTGGMLDIRADYATHIERRAERLAAQEQQERALRNRLRRETEWLRRGPAARSTKQVARIQRAEALSGQVAELAVRTAAPALSVDFGSSGRGTKRLIEAKGIAKAYGDRPLFAGLDLLLGPGTRLGLIGPNGCGKTTLLRVLLGQEAPDKGRVRHADSLRVAAFEQNREALDPTASVVDTVCPGGEFVSFQQRRLHRHGYLNRFGFARQQMTMRVGQLSGGEQARLLIARLMLEPADILVLDEPTNDLDLETLAVLQEALTSFDGAVLLVSHDRLFLDQVSTRILAFPKPGTGTEVAAFAELAQWQPWYEAQLASDKPRGRRANREKQRPRTKLSYKDRRDLQSIEDRIQQAEKHLAELEAECQREEVFVDGPRLLELQEQMKTARSQIDALYERWAALEALGASLQGRA